MKKRTVEDIKAFCEKLWTFENYEKDLCDAAVVVEQRADGIYITVTQMYESPPGLSLKQLKELSEYLKTDDIEDVDRISQGGCETCDYGSKYGFTLRAKE